MAAFPIQRGTNISHWLSQSNDRGEARKRRFTREDAARLADLGFDHLRLPIDEEQMWTANGAREPEAWDLLNEGLDWCEEFGLRAIVDLHILRSHHFNTGCKLLFSDPAAPEQWADLWRDLSKELRPRALDQVAYELMNEPVAEDADDWNRVLRAPYAAIRELEPERMIAIGSNRWNHVASYPEFAPPENDPNLLLVFHFYNPMQITHYMAYWVKGMCDYRGAIQYPGRPVPEEELEKLSPELRERIEEVNEPYDRAVMEASLQPALDKAQQMGLRLWCNEFGVISKAPDAIRKAWYLDFIAVLEKHNIAWTNWDMRGDFGLFDKNNEDTVVVQSLLQ